MPTILHPELWEPIAVGLMVTGTALLWVAFGLMTMRHLGRERE